VVEAVGWRWAPRLQSAPARAAVAWPRRTDACSAAACERKAQAAPMQAAQMPVRGAPMLVRVVHTLVLPVVRPLELAPRGEGATPFDVHLVAPALAPPWGRICRAAKEGGTLCERRRRRLQWRPRHRAVPSAPPGGKRRAMNSGPPPPPQLARGSVPHRPLSAAVALMPWPLVGARGFAAAGQFGCHAPRRRGCWALRRPRGCRPRRAKEHGWRPATS